MVEPDEAPNQVAVIGMAGRFPRSPDVPSFWENLRLGRECVETFTEEELRAAGVAADLLRRPNYVRAKGVLDGADLFDAGFFGYGPREAEILDPQHRVLLECAWEALEAAGLDPAATEDRIGVFAGSSLSSYLLYNLAANPRAVEAVGGYQALLANDKDFLATRISYKLGLTGPGVTVQTACSTSLAAVHYACQSLLNHECDIALAGGVSVSVPLREGYLHHNGGILSPDGHCRPFDADAAGTVAGNGAGLVVLRRLADARDARDAVHAVIRGTAVNNDGSLKVGYTAPSAQGQAEVVSEALAVAGVHPREIGYVEAHGTGTALGDPIEIAALSRAFREHTPDIGYCALGSVKGNVGHLDAAAGVTALIKTVLALSNEAIPPSLHHTRPNPELALETSPFFVNTRLRPWTRGDAPRYAGVSSFGIGGTNVHVVLGEGTAAAAAEGTRSWRLLTVSGKTGQAARDNAARLADHLERHPGTDLDDAAFTLAARRRHFDHRLTVVARDGTGAAQELRRLGDSAAAAREPAARHAPVVFLFPGQGAQYPGMAGGLYAEEPVFAAEFDRCADLFAPHIGEDLRRLVFETSGAQAEERLARTALTQPALFAVEYALARLLASWGVTPAAMIGHSVGEYTAACLAEVFALPDAVRTVAARGRLVQRMPGGAMLSVELSEAEVRDRLDAGLCVAAANAPDLCTVSGPAAAVDELQRRLAAEGVGHRRLRTSHGFHSPSMSGAVEPFVEELRGTALGPPRLPFHSNVTGEWITEEQARSPEYWGSHLRRPVRFTDAVEKVLDDPDAILLEVGPGRSLSGLVRRHGNAAGRTVLAALRHPREKGEDAAHLLGTLGALWKAGVPVDWRGFHAAEERRPVPLPGYAFQRRRFWIDREAAPARAEGAADTTGAAGTADTGDTGDAAANLYTPSWRRLPQAAPDTADPGGEETAWIVLGADLPVGAAIADRAERTGAAVTRVAAGDGAFDATGPLEKAVALRPRLVRIVHAWSLSGDGGAAPAAGPAALEAARGHGFDSLLALGRALGDVRRPGVPVAVDVLCGSVHSVTGEERLRPEHALLFGPCVVLPQEVPDVTCRVLDIGEAGPGRPAAMDALHRMLARPAGAADPDPTGLALRGRHWWARTFEPARFGERPDGGTALRDRGVYLITGGLGGVGLALAEHIAATAHRPVLALLGRSGLPPEQDWDGLLRSPAGASGDAAVIRRVRRLRERGAEVVVLRADVTDRAETLAAVAGLRQRSGPLNGVVHAAGTPSLGLMAGKTREDADAVLAPKTRGTLVLDEVCAEDDLDFFLLCSSRTALLGGPGQSDYAAANAYLDAFAEARRAGGAPVTSIAWDTWRDTGMAAGLPAALGGGSGGSGGSPLLSPVRDTGERTTYATFFSTADDWIVDEHRIMGHGLVPGTAYLELVREAVKGEAGDRAVELRDVVFTLPLIVPDGRRAEVHTTIDRGGGRTRFRVTSRAPAVDGAAAWHEHAAGEIVFPAPDAGEPRDLRWIREQGGCTEILDTEEEFKRRVGLDRVERGGIVEFAFGPRWRCVREVAVGAERLLVTLRLDEAFVPDLAEHPLHPALLDVAGASARIRARDVYYLPFTYRRVRVHADLTPTVHCDVRLSGPGASSGETLTCDMEILDPDGRLLVEVTGFTIKRINDLEAMVEQIRRAAQAGEPPGAGPQEAPGVLAALAAGLSGERCLEVFDRVLRAAEPPAALVVSGADLAEARRLARSITPELLLREAEALVPDGAAHARPDIGTPYVEPDTDDARAVAAIWQEVLGIEGIGLHDDFFALGGHSLAAVQIGARIQSRFGTELDLRDFFEEPTVAGTVTVLAEAAKSGEAGRNGADGDGPGGDGGIPVLPRGGPPSRDGAGPDGLGADALDAMSDEEVEARLRELLAEERRENRENEA